MGDTRIRLQPLSEPSHPDREVYIGWDSALQTYFAQVFDGVDEYGEDRLTLDIGNDIGQITTPADVIEALRPYAEIPDGLPDLLELSRAEDETIIADLRPQVLDAVSQEWRDLVPPASTLDHFPFDDEMFGDDEGFHSGMGY
ncbi:hypothetical protein [Saccharothrix sp.]|uniref:hypothetical protein n=1 Tax=Saccharothrix sp. TaxID=1873460 RepID=UPI00281123AB|nr:hypothetical protein [Saccharothrix sp.]